MDFGRALAIAFATGNGRKLQEGEVDQTEQVPWLYGYVGIAIVVVAQLDQSVARLEAADREDARRYLVRPVGVAPAADDALGRIEDVSYDGARRREAACTGALEIDFAREVAVHLDGVEHAIHLRERRAGRLR